MHELSQPQHATLSVATARFASAIPYQMEFYLKHPHTLLVNLDDSLRLNACNSRREHFYDNLLLIDVSREARLP
jgi:hypothetical protein